jgi:homocysteine S-methyltransferase
MAFHRERLRVLAAAGPDLLAAETIPELEEGIAIARLLDEMPGTRAWLTFSCADGAHLRSGALFAEAVDAVAAATGVVAVGVNCTAPEHVESLVRIARSTTMKPVVVYPNNGEGWDAVGRRWTGAPGARVDPVAAARWRAAGAALIGGCCRVTPDQIALLSAAFDPSGVDT